MCGRRRARVWAAERGTSVSATVKEYLASLDDQQQRQTRLRRLQDEVLAELTSFSAADRLGREEVHDRAVR